MQLLARIYLDSGTEYESDTDQDFPSRFYEARVLQWGAINRTIPVPAGLPQVSDAKLRISDTDNRFRDLFTNASPPQTPMERIVDVRVLSDDDPEDGGVVINTGEITKFEFGDGYVELSLHDVTLSWLDEEWPGFLDLGVYAPTIFGRCIQNSATDQHGLIPLPHIGFDIAIGDRYIASWHTNDNFVAIHRHNVDGTWEVVDASEYSITEDDVNIGGTTYTGTYVDFTVQQDDGVEIHADVEGWNTRPAFGSLPPSTGLHRNVIDLFINIMDTVQTKIGKTLQFDAAAIVAIRTLFQTIIDTSPVRAYFHDGAQLEAITIRSLLSRVLTSANLDLFQKVDGKISLAFRHTPNSGREVFTEAFEILDGSFLDHSPEAFNRIKCKMARNYALGDWSIEQIHNNTVDQNKLGTGTPKVRAADLEMWWCRDRFTAADVAAHRAGLMALDSYDVEFTIPLELGAHRELCEQIGVTVPSRGLDNEEVRIDGLTHDLDNLTTRVFGRIYRQQERNATSSLTYELDADITITSDMDAEITETV